MKFIRNLEMALVRIENKTYGICRDHGKLIPKERLMKVPHATECIEGQRGPQVIRIGRSPLRKAPAGRFRPTRIFSQRWRRAAGICPAHASIAVLLAAGLYPAPAHASGHTPQRQVFIHGTCARFEAHSSAAGLHPAPAHASGHTPQRQVFIRHLRLLRGTLLSGPLLPRVARQGLAAAAEYLSEREADAVAEAGDGRGVSRHPACGIARVRPKNAGTMPLAAEWQGSKRQRVRSRLVCLVAKPRISARTDVAQRNRMGSTPERRCGRMPCQGFEAANSYAAEWHPTGNTSLRKSCRGAVLRFHPAPAPFPPRSIPTTSRGQLFEPIFRIRPGAHRPECAAAPNADDDRFAMQSRPPLPQPPQSDGKGRPHRAGMINRPRVREALHTQTDEPAPGKGGSK